MSSLVLAASWDISLGLAGMSLGRYILNHTSESAEVAPNGVDHVGLKVFGSLYEYGDLGVLKTEIPEEKGNRLKSKYPAFTLRSVEELGMTEKTVEEFEEWVDEMNSGDFQGSKYDVVNNSCVVWGIKAAQFLNVPYPPNWDRLAMWAVKNKSFTSFVGTSGLGSRHFQHKATATPHRIKAKVKRLYRKIKPKKLPQIDTDPDTQNNNGQPPQVILNSNDSDNDTDDDDDSDSSSSSSSSSNDNKDDHRQCKDSKKDGDFKENEP